MQCEGFKPGCTNEAQYTIKGYHFCLDCYRAFAGHAPPQPKFTVGQTVAVNLPTARRHGETVRIIRREFQEEVWVYWLDLSPETSPEGVATVEQFLLVPNGA